MFRSEYIFFALSIFLTTLKKVRSFPSAAGHCDAGNAIKLGHGSDGSGFLSDAGYKLIVNGVPVSRGSTTTLDVGVDHSLTLLATSFDFKGFMFRLSKNGVDTSSALSVVDDTNSRTNPQCTGKNSVAASICHNHNQPKDSINLQLKFDAPTDMLLDLTVVRDNTGGFSNSWYHNSYNFVMQAGAPTPSPSMKPTDGEDPDAEFFYKKTKAGRVITKTCSWLSTRKKVTTHKICTLPKYNKSFEDYGPASKVCVDTCGPYPCVPDEDQPKFLLKIKSDKFILKKCRWLQKKRKGTQQRACERTASSGDPALVASDVCFTTCCVK